MMAEGQANPIQIYPSSAASSGRQVTPFWKEKYEREAKKYWDVFYRRHKDKFFKDRHYLDKEWGEHFQAGDREQLVVLEVGCGAGNTIFPLAATYPNIFIHACDFSPRAIDLVKAHKDFRNDQINAFVCDLTTNSLCEQIKPLSVDIVTMIFVLSAVSPEKMSLILHNIGKVLKPDGRVLFRDYALGDLAQERLNSKEQQISDNFFVRGDGTRAYYFSEEFLSDLFAQNGFKTESMRICNKQVKNRSLGVVMNRRWIQATFDSKSSHQVGDNSKLNNDDTSKVPANDSEIDVSESISEMFGMSLFSFDEVAEIKISGQSVRIKGLGKEYQHTCKSTGLMLWESARFMCDVLCENAAITSGKRVLELGCGSSGICSMAAAQFAELVVSTDADTEALGLLEQNIASNLPPGLREKIVPRQLVWGNKQHLDAVRELCGGSYFDLIIGTDVTYDREAIPSLFETARQLMPGGVGDGMEPASALVLCHVQRRVDEDTILSYASKGDAGFALVDRWDSNGIHGSGGILSSWLPREAGDGNSAHKAPLTVLYFHAV